MWEKGLYFFSIHSILGFIGVRELKARGLSRIDTLWALSPLISLYLLIYQSDLLQRHTSIMSTKAK
jgi:hypothetical protein